jgi:hypothetical protein
MNKEKETDNKRMIECNEKHYYSIRREPLYLHRDQQRYMYVHIQYIYPYKHKRRHLGTQCYANNRSGLHARRLFLPTTWILLPPFKPNSDRSRRVKPPETPNSPGPFASLEPSSRAKLEADTGAFTAPLALF